MSVLATLFVAIQFARAERTNPPVHGRLVAPPEVEDPIRRACFDCHSNETRWPWYTGVAPFSWVATHDVSAGRQRLNFSDWTDYASDPETKNHKLEEIVQSIARGDMAPWYYRALHAEARLRHDERDLIARWAHQEANDAVPDGNSGRVH